MPAAIANMVLPLFKNVRFLAAPVDFGKSFRGNRIFGDHKTWKGLVFGTLAAVIVVYLEKMFLGQMGLVDYQVVSVVGFGLALGLGSLIGDLVKSFFKRQLGVAPGKAWIPFDQIDWILGALVALSFFIGLTVSFVVVSLILFGILHIIANQIGYYLKINKEKF